MDLEAHILHLLEQRGGGKTICPSEVAREAYPAKEWRKHMQAVRNAAQRLVDRGSILATQKGHAVDIADAKGPIRLKLR